MLSENSERKGVRHMPSKQELLETLEDAYQTIGEALGYLEPEDDEPEEEEVE